jgi:hypothetical protein
MKLDVHTEGHSLFLRPEDGWNEELVDSIMGAGEYKRDHRGYFTLRIDQGICTFDETRLREIAGHVYRRGKIVTLREREHCLKYYSQVGVFIFGDTSDYYGRFGRDR